MQKNLFVTLVVCMLHVTFIYSQSNHNSNISTSSTAHAEPLGWITIGGSVSNDLDIDNNFSSKNINLSTFNGSLIKRMTILSTGEVGIGNFTPSFMLDVDAGDINLNTATNHSYMISGTPVLWHNGNPVDIFVGEGAGNATMSGHQNTVIGYLTGNVLNAGQNNTAIGTTAGTALTDGNDNTAIGFEALFSNAALHNNVAVGSGALHESNTMTCASCIPNWSDNTAVGFQSLYNTQAYGGCALGFWAGHENTGGCSLVAIGEVAAYHNTDGNDNVAVGEAAFVHNTALSDNVAIGTQALATQSYSGSGTASSWNVAVGNYALYTNDPTGDEDGIYNTALGSSSLYENTTGLGNLGCGYQAGGSNQTGWWNVNLGYYAGYYNSLGYGTFVGAFAGEYNTSGGDGNYNSFIGYQAGLVTSTGGYNTFVGLDAGYANTGGDDNSGLGVQVLGQTTGSCNTGSGYMAGYAITTGSDNTFVGCRADATGNYSNSAAFGSGATTTASNRIMIGNSAVGWIGGYSAWHNISDGRFKINVQENVRGLDFIKRLRPVTYNLNAQAVDSFVNQNKVATTDSSGNIIASPPKDFTASSSILHSGFIAQEVEQASLASGFTSSIVSVPANATDPYSLSYEEFVVPLVKAVQELDSSVLELDSIVKAQADIIQSLQGGNGQRVVPGNNEGNDNNQKATGAIDVTLSSKTIVLNQNSPNPFKESTVITYTIPEGSKNVKIIFTDSRSNVLKEVVITQTGNGQLNVYAQDLSSGIYSYTLVVAGVTIDSKKMICNK